MPNPKRLHITGHRGNWKGKREGSERASFKADTKAEAIGKGRDLVKKEKGQIIIHKTDGTIQEERTYGKDPFPPKG